MSAAPSLREMRDGSHAGVAAKWWRPVGFLLVIAGCVGFATVADDLRHKGELFGVGGILTAGLALLADGSNRSILRGLAPRWVAVGIGIGGVVGALLDAVPKGVSSGAMLGVLCAIILPRLSR